MITRTTRTGQTLEVKVNDFRFATFTALLDGKYLCGGRIEKRSDLPAGFTHAVGRAVLTEAEAATLQGELDANSEYQLARLIEHRDSLLRTIRANEDELAYRRNRSYESGDGTGKWAEMPLTDHEARAALAEFDAAHPEAKEAMAAERKANAERAMWN